MYSTYGDSLETLRKRSSGTNAFLYRNYLLNWKMNFVFFVSGVKNQLFFMFILDQCYSSPWFSFFIFSLYTYALVSEQLLSSIIIMMELGNCSKCLSCLMLSNVVVVVVVVYFILSRLL